MTLGFEYAYVRPDVSQVGESVLRNETVLPDVTTLMYSVPYMLLDVTGVHTPSATTTYFLYRLPE